MTSALEAILSNRRLLIFDLDGTIADTSAIHAAAFQEAFAPFGVEVDYAPLAGLGTEQAVLQVLQTHRLTVDSLGQAEIVATKRAVARRGLASARLIDGAFGFLQIARRRHSLAMYSSGSRTTVKATLDCIGLSDWFDPLVTGADVVNPKPDPQGYRHVLERTGTAPRDALIFEDSAPGAAAARAAGIDVVMIVSGDCPITAQCSDLSARWHELSMVLR